MCFNIQVLRFKPLSQVGFNERSSQNTTYFGVDARRLRIGRKQNVSRGSLTLFHHRPWRPSPMGSSPSDRPFQSLTEKFSSKPFRSTPLASLTKKALLQYMNIPQNTSVQSIVLFSSLLSLAEALVEGQEPCPTAPPIQGFGRRLPLLFIRAHAGSNRYRSTKDGREEPCPFNGYPRNHITAFFVDEFDLGRLYRENKKCCKANTVAHRGHAADTALSDDDGSTKKRSRTLERRVQRTIISDLLLIYMKDEDDAMGVDGEPSASGGISNLVSNDDTRVPAVVVNGGDQTREVIDLVSSDGPTAVVDERRTRQVAPNVIDLVSSDDDDNEASVQKVKGKGKAKVQAIEKPIVARNKGKDKAKVEPIAGPSNARAQTTTKVVNSSPKERRAARHRTAQAYPEHAVEQRKESGRSRSPMIADFWISVFTHLAQRELAAQEVKTAEMTDLEFIQIQVAVFCKAENHVPIPPSDPIWSTFSPRVVELLATIGRDPTGWKAQPFLDDGTLVLSERGDPPPDSACACYLRQIDVPEPKKALILYLHHAADAASTVLQLILQGSSITTIEKSFHAAMIQYGLEDGVASFLDYVKKHPATAKLHGIQHSSSPQTRPYTGITARTAPGDRGWNDLDGESDVRIINFLKDNNHTLTWTTYHIPDMDTPITDPLDVRTSIPISQKERIIRALLGGAAMNSAHGGVRPIHLPSEQFVQLKNRVRELGPAPHPFPLGQERDLTLEGRIGQLIHDEINAIRRATGSKISLRGLAAVLETGTALRNLKGKVVKLEVTKDISREAYEGHTGAYWHGTIGQGPQEHRYMAHLLNPTGIPELGNLLRDVVALYLGPTFDFWRLLLRHILYWLHVLFLSRMLITIRPLLVISQSNPVAAMLRSGDLAAVWRLLSGDEATAILDGQTPAHIEDRLPTRRYREMRKGQFTAVIGSINIIPIGQDPADLSLHIPHADYGRLKYDPILARLRWDVDHLVELIAETVTRILAAHLRSGASIVWTDADAVRGFLQGVKTDTTTILSQSGLTAALDSAKNSARHAELAVNFLRVLSSSKVAHEEWLEFGGFDQPRRVGILALGRPQSDERRDQLDDILVQARELDSYDLPPDPNCFGSFRHPILSETFPPWFLGLKKDTDIVYASNALGRDEEAHQAVEANSERFSEWRRNTPVVVDHIAILRKNLIQTIRECAEGSSYPIIDFLDCSRKIFCPDCRSFGIGRHSQAKHTCMIGPRTGEGRPLSGTHFIDVERVLYVHDIINNRLMLEVLGEIEDVLAELQLIAVPVKTILDCPYQQSALQAILPVIDFKAIRAAPTPDCSVYVPRHRVDDKRLLLILAVDTVLSTASTCPPSFMPLNPDTRSAFSEKGATLLQKWFTAGNRNLYLVTCPGPPGTKVLADVFLSDQVVPRKRKKPGFRVGGSGGRRCAICGNSDCDYRDYQPVATLLDLPPHHARYVWLNLMRGTTRAEKRASKESKKNKNRRERKGKGKRELDVE
ncbi:hypothetical protein C8R43DRAFT_947910 [Mycena crocata]|nr:hypothetical protein C8R43DRAFT_947910 [Mycena crocata]